MEQNSHFYWSEEDAAERFRLKDNSQCLWNAEERYPAVRTPLGVPRSSFAWGIDAMAWRLRLKAQRELAAAKKQAGFSKI